MTLGELLNYFYGSVRIVEISDSKKKRTIFRSLFFGSIHTLPYYLESRKVIEIYVSKKFCYTLEVLVSDKKDGVE